MHFPFIDYVKVSFSTAGTDIHLHTMGYKAMVSIEITNNDNTADQSIFVPDSGVIDRDIILYGNNHPSIGDLIPPSTTVLNSGQQIRATGSGDTIAGFLHIFRLPEDIS